VAKVTGAAQYAGDIRRPGMLYACLLRPPAHGAKLTRVDTSAAARLPGVTVVDKDGLVATLHADPEAAKKALAAVAATWETPQPPFDTESVFEHLVKAGGEGEVESAKGDVAAARAAAGARLFTSTFHKGYVAHAPIEPHTAVAEVVDGKLTVWSSTQTPFPTRDGIVRELGLAEDKVRVITPFVGGGFGGKSAAPQSLEAARLAVITGKPVMVAWSRAEEFFLDAFDPAAVVRVVTALDGAGKITLWEYHVVAAGDRGVELFYDVPNVTIRVAGGWRGAEELHLFAVGPWRAPGANMNVFAKESQVDIMAAAAGIDPVELRLRNMSDARMRRVLEAAAAAYGWKPRARPAAGGRGRGVACGIDAGSYVALIADVAVDSATGAVKVERVVAAQEMGVIVNPRARRCRWRGASLKGWATRSPRSCASPAARSSTATSTPTRCRASPGCRASRPCSSRTTSSIPRAAASPRSCRWAGRSPTPSSTPPGALLPPAAHPRPCPRRPRQGEGARREAKVACALRLPVIPSALQAGRGPSSLCALEDPVSFRAKRGIPPHCEGGRRRSKCAGILRHLCGARRE